VSLGLIRHHTIKAYREVKAKLHDSGHLSSLGVELSYPLARRMDGLQNQSGDRENLFL
jgi:hypothetical protein